jgi:hypothetical protein
MKVFSVFSAWALSAFLVVQSTSGQSTDPLVDTLLKKGVVTRDDFKGDALTREALLDVLVRKGILNAEEGLQLKAQAQKSYATKEDVAAVKEEVQAIVREDAGGSALPKWLDGLTIKGDVRTRYEGYDYDGKKTATGAEDPDKRQRNRGRIRARLGVEKKWSNGVQTGVRIATGKTGSLTNDPISTNQSFGDPDMANKALYLDQAYISYKPEAAEWVTLTAGRIANPFVCTSMVWDGDLNFDGVAELLSYKASDDLRAFANLGQFVMKEQAGQHGGASGVDALLWCWQGGATYNFTDTLGTTLAVAYYDYQNPDVWIPALVFGYRILDVVNTYSIQLGELPLSLRWDVASNMAGDKGATKLEDDLAWGVGATLGKMKKQGSWELSVEYDRIELNSVFPAFTDSDFQSTNRRGVKFGGGYQLFDNLALNLTVFVTENIDQQARPTGWDQDFVRWQLDAVVKF